MIDVDVVDVCTCQNFKLVLDVKAAGMSLDLLL